MSDQKSVAKSTPFPAKATEFVGGAVGKLNPADAFNALHQIVAVVRESIQIHEAESTKREKLKTYREIEVARIKASEKILQDYFDRVFEERRETHRRLFESLDQALESGDVAAMQAVVGGIVEIARTSPLAGLGNLGELRRAMDDPNDIAPSQTHKLVRMDVDGVKQCTYECLEHQPAARQGSARDQDTGLAYAASPVSNNTQSSSPTVQASCPGSKTNTSPAPTVASVPSSERTVICPDTQMPECRVIHESVPAIGFTSSDHFQPGSKVPLPKVKSPSVTTSM